GALRGVDLGGGRCSHNLPSFRCRSHQHLNQSSALRSRRSTRVPGFYLRIERFWRRREISEQRRTQPAFDIEVGGIVPVATAFLASPIEPVLMAWKWRAGKDQRETMLGIGNVSHHTVDPGVGAGNKRFLRQTNAHIVKHPLAVVLVRRNQVDRIHPESSLLRYSSAN